MYAACAWTVAAVVNLALAPIVIAGAVTCAVLARQARVLSEQARHATRNAAQLTSRVVMHTAPYLECEVCHATLNPAVGIAVGLDTRGQLRLRCAEHEDLA